jgi:hypothetical protein
MVTQTWWELATVIAATVYKVWYGIGMVEEVFAGD